ncbi:hypothetical protein [Sphingomonas bacterium]|uniref:hypothetical protein n=1 Tax=Sphingomonas bacterium TaxID=1895847 RepID=UPI001C2DEE12|nr:hypothetical protein [Sphingomonas bacterium]
MNYTDFDFKVPIESADYAACSKEVTETLEAIVAASIASGRNKIFINTNLRLGLPMENINKIAGPFVEAWAFETFFDELKRTGSPYHLVNVETRERLHMADVILQFRRTASRNGSVTAEVDVKATAEDIENSGKSPNITSFNRIRSAYVIDPDYMFIILSLKHRVYSRRNDETFLMDGVMEVVGHNAYDLKYVGTSDLTYNPALGTGQIQIRDIHYVSSEARST